MTVVSVLAAMVEGSTAVHPVQVQVQQDHPEVSEDNN
jgi:hypothetical protein